MEKKITIAGLILFVVIELYAQVQITENNSSRYAFSWNLEKCRVDTFKSDQQYCQISFTAENTVLGESGEAVLPGYSILLGIPPEGEIKVIFNSEAVKTITFQSALLKHKDLNSKRQPDVVFKNPWISEPVYSCLQGMRTVRLIIRPFIHDEKTNTVKVLQKGFCSIEFPFYPVRALSVSELSRRSTLLSNMVINYPVASSWYGNRKLTKVAAPSFPVNLSQSFCFRIGDGNISDSNEDDYNEMTTNENGILKISGDFIIKKIGRVNIDAVKLYASYKGELPVEIPDSAEAIPSGLTEVPLLRVDLNKNTFVDSDDFFLAFVTGASDWIFNNDMEYGYNLDRYDDYRKYWLTASNGRGLSVDSFHDYGIAGNTISSIDNRMLFAENTKQLYKSEGSLKWCWKRLFNNDCFDFLLQLPGLDTTFNGVIKIDCYRYYGSIQVFRDVQLMGNSGEYTIKNWGNRSIRIIETGPDTSVVDISNIEVNYKRKLVIGDAGKLEFFSPIDTMLYTYKVKISTNDLLYLFRISNDETHVSLIDTIRNAANSFISWTDTGGKGIRYMICSEKALKFPEWIATAEKIKVDFLIENPRLTSDSTDYLIISAPEFIEAASKLAAHKKKMGFSAPRIINVKDIYNAFSGGDVDPTAIRNFITYVQSYWKGSQYLSYVLLFGSGHYDYKGVLTKKPVYMPVYYNGYTVLEDYYTMRHGNDQAALGRITCNNPDEASDVVDKIIDMEDPERADYSDWRNRVLMVADDDRQGTTPDKINHHYSSDNTADVIESKNPSINISKVYLFDYKWNSAGQKPEASKAILNEIDHGVGYVNYFGHGDKEQWAQEKVLLPENVKILNNKNHYPLISSFSCSVGKFDVPNYECLSSVLLTKGKCGAIATISSTRTAIASTNEHLAKDFYNALFNPDTVYSIGMAFYKAKGTNFSSGCRSYAIFGDPSFVMVNQNNSIKLSVFNKAGEKKDTLMTLQQVTVSGSVVDKNGNIVSNYGTESEPAYIQLGLFNLAEETGRKDGGENVTIRYKMPGTAIFLGKTQVQNGKFQQTVQLPANLSFEKCGVKLTAYAWREGKTEAATGFKGDIIFSGTDSSIAANDSTGPQITIRPVHDHPEMTTEKMSFSGQVIEMDSLKCVVDIFDQSGIDVIGTGPNEGLTFEIEGVIRQQNINPKFRFSEGDFRKGSVLLRENVLKPDNYTLNITARDLHGNMSKASFQIKITQPQEFKLDQVFNCPNPFKMGWGTKFYFFPTRTSLQTVAAIKIYTLSGKPVCVIKNAVNGQFWDGRDQTGSLLSPDIYLYQIAASAPQEKKKIKSKIMKLVINP